ncbi:MAG: zinc-dependent metalloprotease, partial [Gemmatimonadetes bacterium]|nr:zinc-dependent metalloprotease [Gemmatimonadota bacterium]
AVLNRRFAHVYLHHRYALQGATKYVGGMEFGYALRGEQTDPTRVLPPDEQRRALELVLSSLGPSALRIPDRVAALIPPVPSGYDADLTLIPTRAGTAFDPLGAAHSLAQEVVDGLLHPERAARLVSFHARDPVNPSLAEVVSKLVSSTWGPTAPGGERTSAQDAALRRVAQRSVVDGLLDLAGSPTATADAASETMRSITAARSRWVLSTITASRAGRSGLSSRLLSYSSRRRRSSARPM